MRFLILITSLFFLSVSTASADTYVNGYYRKDGTYVKPHYRSDPNGSKMDNWSTKGNVNPYTGQIGTIDPYKSKPRSGASGLENPYGKQPNRTLYGN